MSTMDKLSKCPKCGASWDAGAIPEAHREHYTPPFRYSRVIAVTEHDRTVAWLCPDCGARFTKEAA